MCAPLLLSVWVVLSQVSSTCIVRLNRLKLYNIMCLPHPVDMCMWWSQENSVVCQSRSCICFPTGDSFEVKFAKFEVWLLAWKFSKNMMFKKNKNKSVGYRPTVQHRFSHARNVADPGRQGAPAFVKAVCGDASQKPAAVCLETMVIVAGRRLRT